MDPDTSRPFSSTSILLISLLTSVLSAVFSYMFFTYALPLFAYSTNNHNTTVLSTSTPIESLAFSPTEQQTMDYSQVVSTTTHTVSTTSSSTEEQSPVVLNVSTKEPVGTTLHQAGETTIAKKTSQISPPEELKLDVPYFKQEYAHSCEAASLRMALAYYGIYKSDMDITQAFGYKPRIKNIDENIWDDPQEMFVGFIDADVGKKNQGYGVYGKPVLKAVESFGRTGTYKTDITASDLAKEIKDGHPIVIWGYTSLTEAPYEWSTEQGKRVRAFRGEHARLIVGVRGSVSKPLGFYLHDPINGKSFEYWDTQRLFEHIYAVSGVTDQAVIVR